MEMSPSTQYEMILKCVHIIARNCTLAAQLYEFLWIYKEIVFKKFYYEKFQSFARAMLCRLYK
jgi:predicted YcjX-like family ATPase